MQLQRSAETCDFVHQRTAVLQAGKVNHLY